MAKPRVSAPSGSFECYTGFQLRMLQMPHNVADITEHRLATIAAAADGSRALALERLLADYRLGRVAVAWHRGRPVAVRLDRPA